jgi:hypothetical protein
MTERNEAERDTVTRRLFLRATAGALTATALISTVGRPTTLLGESSAIRADATTYICPPCGQPCDKLTFDKPGTCPGCGMTLVKDASTLQTIEVVRFPDGKTSVEFPFELLANGLFFQVQADGNGPLTFAMDTGSFNSIVASEMVGKLGIKTQGTGFGTGSGTSFSTNAISRLNLGLPGGLVLSTTSGAAISMAGLSPLIGRRFDGLLGYDVLKHLVVQINYEKELITLYDPAHFEYKGKGSSIPFTLWNNYDPEIEGEISISGQPPVPVRIVLDTGAGGTVLTTPFVNAHKLINGIRTRPSPDVGAGGGESIKWEARAESIRIGPYSIDQPLVSLSTDTIGTFAHAQFDMNLGGNLLRRFTLIIDYPKQKLILEPNSHFHEPFLSDASGLILAATGLDYKTFVARSVIPASPAADAGFEVGDILTALDGRSLDKYALWELEDKLKNDGQVYEVTVLRNNGPRTLELKLKALL